MSAESKPYVVSADLFGVLKTWEKKNGYTTPTKNYINCVSRDLKSVLESTLPGNSVEIVPEDEIRNGVNRLIRLSKYPIVSLDRVYVDDQNLRGSLLGHIDVTRAVDEKYEKLGLMPREGFPSLDVQISRLAKNHQGPVALVDDVIFSGSDLVCKNGIFEKMGNAGLPVKQVITGIGIGEGVGKIRNADVKVDSVREYDDVKDEVCKRDFFACVPFSGSMLVDKRGQIWSAPYFRPFGDPESRASIPGDKVSEFSRYCLIKSMELWGEVEKLSQTVVLTENTPRQIRELKKGVSVVKALREHLDSQAYLR